MKPAIRVRPSNPALSAEILRSSLSEASAAHSSSWRASLPGDRQTVYHVSFKNLKQFIDQDIDPFTGEILPDSGTLGATGFIYPFHYSLYLELIGLGKWIVGVAGMAMLLLCVSGVIIHKKIFLEFFTLRVRSKSGRIMLDLHNISGVFGIPFYFIMIFSGLTILGTSYFSNGVRAFYPDVRTYLEDAYDVFQTGKMSNEAAPVGSLEGIIAQAKIMWGGDKPQKVLINWPGTSDGIVRLVRDGSTNGVSLPGDLLTFNAKTGQLLAHQAPLRPAVRVQVFLAGLHLVSFHHWVLRWLYFALGLTGCVTISTGFLFWLESRRKKQGSNFGFHLVEGVAAASVTGIILATLTFFVANRLLPSGARFYSLDRAALEVGAFYLVWLATFAHGWTRPRRVWVEQSLAIGGFALTAVMLNWLTTSDPLWRTLLHRYLWPVAGMDTLLLLGGGLAFWTGISLARRARETAHD